ncbi:MAG TPA: SulP family inorganic anion transporter [Spirillospora sp.]|nr:SulP family inorganic anion transporter [Spirillospora sp.]
MAERPARPARLATGIAGVHRGALPREILAGVTLAALAIPLNIGYAQIAGLPPVVGLYAAIVPLLVFALAALVPGAIAICAVTLADGLLTARRYAEQRGYRIDANQELRAFGIANIAAGLTQSMTVGASASRTAAMDAAASRTQIPSLTCAVLVAVLLASFSRVLAYLPSAALAGIVAVAVVRLIDVPAFTRLWRLRRSEFWIAAGCALGVPVLGSLTAVIIAFLLSAVEVVRRAARPATATLQPGPNGRYLRMSPDPDPGAPAQAVPGLVIYRFESQLFFANAVPFKNRILGLAADGVRWIVLDAEAVTDIDTTAAQTLHEVRTVLTDRGITFAMSRTTASITGMLTHYGLGGIPRYDSNEAAARAFQATG